MDKLPRMDEKQHKRVRKLIRTRCCNYDNGNCLALDLGFCSVCPQWISYSLNCKWFRNAVLPQDLELESSILNAQAEGKAEKRCAVCGKPVQSNYPQTKYCPQCAVQVRRRQQAQWAKKKRGAASTF